MLLAVTGVASPALADDAKVAVQVEVVLASLSGNTIDPPTLKAMQDAMSKKVKYGSLKRQSNEKVELLAGKPHTMKLPNGTEVVLSLDKIEKDVATVGVKTAAAEATFNTGRRGSVYVPAGKQGKGDGKQGEDGGQHVEDDLWLVLSPSK